MIVWAGVALVDGAAIADFAVCVRDGLIVAAGPRHQIEAQYPNDERSGGSELLMLPGLVNAHDHGRALGTQSLGISDTFLELWLRRLESEPLLSPELAAAWEGLQLIRSGVTATAHSHNPQTWQSQFDELPHTLRGYRAAGVRVALHPVIIDQNPLVYADAEAFLRSLPSSLVAAAQQALRAPLLHADDYFNGLDALYAEHHDAVAHRVHVQASPAGGQWCSDDLILRAVDWARARRTRVQMHMLETRYQRAYAFTIWGVGFVRHLDEIGALGDWLTLAHMVWVEPDDPTLLSERRVGVAHNPSSNLRLRSGTAPLAHLLQVGLRTGIGMDGQTLDDDQDYLRELRLAWTLANQPAMASADVSASAIWQCGTRGGASVTFGDSVPLGQLQPGYLADLVLLDAAALRGAWSPSGHPTPELWPDFALRRASRQHVRHVMVHGEWLLRDGLHTRLDEAELAAAIRAELAAHLSRPVQDDPLAAHLRRFYAVWDEGGRRDLVSK
ncbi:MAG: amidohydrolase family protein [Anaerolineae bacterium]|nr:amidohydrolase family protein [Anaerolineae bacterium]MDW8172716.1 amidohydrolase family protein [Anaerolineae bacterium]